MELTELKKKKRELETQIFHLIYEFEKETSVKVSEVALIQDEGDNLDLHLKIGL